MSTGWAGQRQGNECATFADGMTIRQGGAAAPVQPAPQPVQGMAQQVAPPPSAWTQPGAAYQPPPQGHWKRDDDDDDRRKYGHPKKRKGFLSDLLDFD